MGVTNEKPAVAANQVWRKSDGWEFTVTDVSGDLYHARRGTLIGSGNADHLRATGECIGVETPAGRVMVGEWRQPPSGAPSEVLSILINDQVRVSMTGGITAVWSAEHIAGWPSLADTARMARAAVDALSDAIFRKDQCEHAGCSAAPEPGKRICNGHAMSYGHDLCDGCPPAVHEAVARHRGYMKQARDAAYRKAREDYREKGPGLAAVAPRPAAPDVVYTWEAWALP